MNDGGSAFPFAPNDCFTDERVNGSDGMSLRDWFAGRFASAWVIALTNRCDSGDYRGAPVTDTEILYEANRLGLQQADSMLTARQAKETK